MCAVPVRLVDTSAAFASVAWSLSSCLFPTRSQFLDSIRSVNMGKKEEEEIIRIAKKMDKMAQKKNGVRRLRRMNVYLVSRCEANVAANGL